MIVQAQEYIRGQVGNWAPYEEPSGDPERIPAATEEVFLAHCLALEAQGWEVSLERPQGGALQYALTNTRNNRLWRVWLLP